MSWLTYLSQHLHTVLVLTLQQAILSIEGTVLGVVVAVPMGILLYRRGTIRRVAAAVTEIIQTIPGLALMAIIMVWLGMGNITLVATLFLYSLMPLLHNTIQGMRSVDPAIIDVARGMGMSNAQILWKIRMPLASAILLTGFRVALVTSIGIATMGVFIGAGGLGREIYSGMQVMNGGEIFSGALAAAVLAIVFDAGLSRVAGRRQRKLRQSALRAAAVRVCAESRVSRRRSLTSSDRGDQANPERAGECPWRRSDFMPVSQAGGYHTTL